MLWVLKRTVTLRRFFLTPNQMFKLAHCLSGPTCRHVCHSWDSASNSICVESFDNPFSPSLLFDRHRQTVQTQIRRRRTRRRIRISSAALRIIYWNSNKNGKKYLPVNGLVQLIRVENSIQLKWVKHANAATSHMYLAFGLDINLRPRFACAISDGFAETTGSPMHLLL